MLDVAGCVCRDLLSASFISIAQREDTTGGGGVRVVHPSACPSESTGLESTEGGVGTTKDTCVCAIIPNIIKTPRKFVTYYKHELKDKPTHTHTHLGGGGRPRNTVTPTY